MFQETITKKEKRLKRKRIFAIVVFWLFSIFFGAWGFEFYTLASNALELPIATLWYLCTLTMVCCVLFCVSCIIEI
tara:strand:+ start:848 stop:1075 length:228 start_codon:yes stop_codon:yes gene_type:complete